MSTNNKNILAMMSRYYTFCIGFMEADGSVILGRTQGMGHSSLEPVRAARGHYYWLLARGHYYDYYYSMHALLLTSPAHALQEQHVGHLGEGGGAAIAVDLNGIAVTQHRYQLGGWGGGGGGGGENIIKGEHVTGKNSESIIYKSVGCRYARITSQQVASLQFFTNLCCCHCRHKEAEYDGLKQ